MATFLTTPGISWHVASLVSSARERLFLVSPHLQIPPALLQSIQSAGARVPTSIVFREGALTADVSDRLRRAGKVTLLSNPDLYAACYANEQTMVLTSLSLSEYEKNGSREMGVLVDREMDADLYRAAFNEIVQIAGASSPVDLADTVSR